MIRIYGKSAIITPGYSEEEIRALLAIRLRQRIADMQMSQQLLINTEIAEIERNLELLHNEKRGKRNG